MLKIFHRFVSTIPDDPDSTFVRPSNWNDFHPLSPNVTTLTYAATITPAASHLLTYRLTMTGDATLNLPTGAVDGLRFYMWVIASGANRVLTLTAGYKISGVSNLTSPITITSGSKSKFMIEYDATQNGGQWELTSMVPGF